MSQSLQSRKRKATASPIAKETCEMYDKQFLDDIKASLLKAKKRTACKYDCKGSQCYQTNPRHTAAFSHKHNCNERDIALFKTDTDKFLENTHNIYTCNDNKFSLKWHIEIGARRGEEKSQIYTALYNEYDTFIFFILANVTLHLTEYISLYGKAFLLNIFQYFESNDNTGLFPIDPRSELGETFTEYAPKERHTNQIDYRLGNTTLSGIIKNANISDKEGESELGGGKKRKHKKTHKKKTYKKHTKKRHNKQIKRK
jgi:hypothetical protein